MDAGTLISELKRRRVIRALVGYGIAAFAVLQIIEPVMHGLHWPEEVLSYVVVALAVGFPIVVSLAWIFDVNAGYIERTGPAQGLTGKRLALVLVGIGIIAAAPGVIWYFAVRGIARRSAAPATAPSAPQASIAVLPFADMSPTGDQGYFSDGVAEQILDDLAHVEGLKVIGRTSSFAFRGKNEDLRTIGEKLGVAHVLEGSVRKAGDRVKITAQLINAADASHVWSQTFDRTLSDVFAVQEEIARAVVEGLKLKLLSARTFERRENQTTPEAYAQFLRGNEFWSNGGDWTAAHAAYQKAVALDPTYAPAWAHLAIATDSLADIGDETPVATAARRQLAMEAAEKAVALDPSLARAYAVRGLLRTSTEWNWEGARSDFERALTIAPGDALAMKWYGGLLTVLGRLDEAIKLQQRAVELDPLLFSNWEWLGGTYIYQGNYTLGRSAIQHGLEVSNFKWNHFYWEIFWSYLLEGDLPHAIEAAAKLKDEAERLWTRAAIEHALGHQAEARAALDRLIEKIGAARPFGVATYYGWRGDIDSAFEWLNKAYVAHDAGLIYVKVENSFAPLRNDPRYTALLKRMNLPLD